MARNEQNGQAGYIVEFVTLGKSMKITVFDPASLREVSMIGSPRVPRQQLIQLAVRKLKYVLAKDAAKDKDA